MFGWDIIHVDGASGELRVLDLSLRNMWSMNIKQSTDKYE